MKVSVIIPSFNRADLLPRTIKSVVEQTYSNLEIIVVDDCSKDNTYEVIQQLIQKWPDKDIKYLRHEINKGESGARNTGIKTASGEYVAFLDSDDEWLNEKIQLQLEFLKQANYMFDGVVCEYYSIVSDNNFELIGFRENELFSKNILIYGSGFGIGTNLLIKRTAITSYFDESLRLFADMDWLYNNLLNAKVGVLHKALSNYYKSPMREGAYIQDHAKVFIKKHKETVDKLSFLDKRRFLSTINWYIAIAYDYHKEYKQAIKKYILSLWLSPFYPLGNYKHVIKLMYYYIRDKFLTIGIENDCNR